MTYVELFNFLGQYGRISKNYLNKNGVDDSLLEELVYSEILEPINESEYKIGNIDSLIEFGRKFIEDKKYSDANAIFTCCYMADPTNFKANYQLFYRDLVSRKENIEFKYFDVVYNHLKEHGDECTANYYLLLLGNLFELPERYVSLFNDIELDDILFEEIDSESIYENEFRKEVYNNSYFRVTGMLDEKYTDIPKEDLLFEQKVEKELILKWLFENRLLNKGIYALLYEEKFEELKNILDEKDDKRFLSVSNQYLLKLVNQYLTIKNTDTIPEIKGNGNDTFEAIDNNNYELAIKLLEKHNKEHNIEKTSYLYTMLKKIVSLIKGNINTSDVIKSNSISEEKGQVGLTEKEKQSIKSKIEQLYNGRSAFLLEPMPKEKRSLVRDYVAEFKFVSSFSIGQDPERRVVIRHRPYVSDRVDKVETAREAKRLYNRKKFEEAAKLYELLLKLSKPKDIIYGMYGLTLLQMHRRNEALDYLKIATIMSKDADGVLDYTGLIENIEYPQEKENRKPRVEMEIDEFSGGNKTALNDELLRDLILLTQEGEISLIDACIKLNLSEEDINYVKLLYARDCYYLGKDSEGDKYFKQVEKSKSKDKKVKDLYKDILVNKKYYRNRLDDSGKQLIFIKK